jgi:hypothetical protein
MPVSAGPSASSRRSRDAGVPRFAGFRFFGPPQLKPLMINLRMMLEPKGLLVPAVVARPMPD